MNILKKKMALIDFVFPKLRSLKSWLDKSLKSDVSEDPLKSKMVNGPKHCWNMRQSTINILLDYFQGKWIGKKSLLLTCQVLGHLFETLAADDKYPFLSRDNLTKQIQMQLSQKEKKFSEFFSPFLKYWLCFEYFDLKDDPQRFWISEIKRSENMVR